MLDLIIVLDSFNLSKHIQQGATTDMQGHIVWQRCGFACPPPQILRFNIQTKEPPHQEAPIRQVWENEKHKMVHFLFVVDQSAGSVK